MNYQIPNLLKICPWNFTHIKRQPLKTIFALKAFQVFKNHGDESYELKNSFIITLCYDNVHDYEDLRLQDVLPLKIYLN
jgi:hypothetical protein